MTKNRVLLALIGVAAVCLWARLKVAAVERLGPLEQPLAPSSAAGELVPGAPLVPSEITDTRERSADRTEPTRAPEIQATTARDLRREPARASLEPETGAILRGTVLDPRGSAVAAAVEARVPDDDGGLRTLPTTFGDGEGRFAIERLPPGDYTLFAHHPDFAASLPLEVELLPEEERAGIVLRLRTGATLSGGVRDASGNPVAEHEVRTSGAGEGANERATTDARGGFTFRHLPPGEIEVATTLDDGTELYETLRVSDGDDVSVELAPSTHASVRVHGRVTGGDAPLRAGVIATRDGPQRANTLWSVCTNEEGEYELQLPPGKYVFQIRRDTIDWRTSIEVPDVPDWTRDVAIDLGTISGRVVDDVGRPLANLRVETEPERHEADGHGNGFAFTDEEGRYRIEVPCGLHVVVAGSADSHDADGVPFAEARVAGLRVTSGVELRDVDLRLSRGGTLEVVLRTEDGQFACGELWAFESPRPRRLSAAGRCSHWHLSGLETGTLRLGASSARFATREPVIIDVQPGMNPEIELVLVPAARVHVRARRAGSLVDCALALLDERGTSYPMRSDRPGDAWFGPLPAGRYLCSAEDGTRVERRIEIVDPRDDVEVELDFE